MFLFFSTCKALNTHLREYESIVEVREENVFGKVSGLGGAGGRLREGSEICRLRHVVMEQMEHITISCDRMIYGMTWLLLPPTTQDDGVEFP